jgi:hypothetical protein
VLNYLRGNGRVYGKAAGDGAAEPPLAERIYRRYEAVLAEVAAGRYDAVLFIAHSQGTVITFDLLYRASPDAGPRSPVRLPDADPAWMLVTLGSPLYQLYGAIFPGQYHRDRFDEWAKTGGLRWWNLFYGNDFVGRHLLAATAADEYRGAARTVPELRYEGRAGLTDHCIGVGGHTSYWGNPKLVGRVIRECLRVLLAGSGRPAAAAPDPPRSPLLNDGWIEP